MKDVNLLPTSSSSSSFFVHFPCYPQVGRFPPIRLLQLALSNAHSFFSPRQRERERGNNMFYAISTFARCHHVCTNFRTEYFNLIDKMIFKVENRWQTIEKVSRRHDRRPPKEQKKTCLGAPASPLLMGLELFLAYL